MNVSPTTLEIVSTLSFALAIVHTFLSSKFHQLGNRFENGSLAKKIFHFLGEVEVIFGLWAAVFMVAFFVIQGRLEANNYAQHLSYTEPLFVFAIMLVAATSPILYFANKLILGLAKIIPNSNEWTVYISILVVGPLLGSVITEPAAMTITALLLKSRYYDRKPSEFFMYLTLGILFVNVSIGGVLTHFAAPPVLMVSRTWGWDLNFMFMHFGWKAVLAITLNSSIGTFLLRSELSRKSLSSIPVVNQSPSWLMALHVLFLASIVYFSHEPVIFMGLLMLFICLVAASSKFQSRLRLRESSLVGVFLAGLVILGSLQKWWLGPVLLSMGDLQIYFSSAALTAVTDNAALTFLGSQISGLSDSFKYHLVAGAIAGGGLTVIANAPNPVGFAILESAFEQTGIKPLKLLAYALPPTLITLIVFYF